jgi:pantetheine-phosphate adenylyltransferase
MPKKYTHAALGGTFDRFHKGHESLLLRALEAAESVTVGVTTNTMVLTKVMADIILPYQERLNSITHFLKAKKMSKRVNFVPLTDLYGPTLTDKTMDALVVTDHTAAGALKINQARTKQGLEMLPILKAELIKDSLGRYISSTLIRRGLINREGKAYVHLTEKDIYINQQQKQILQYPQGVLLKNPIKVVAHLISQANGVALVGDYITQWFYDHDFDFDYTVVDGMSQRMPFELQHIHWVPDLVIRAKNPAGSLSAEMARAARQALTHERAKVVIEGEEDLAAIVLLLFMPLGGVLFYGQPDRGVVCLDVTEQTKEHFAHFINADW